MNQLEHGNDLTGNQQGHGNRSGRLKFRKLRIAKRINRLQRNRFLPLDRFLRNGRIPAPGTNAGETCSLMTIRLASYKFSVGSRTPEIRSSCGKKRSSETTCRKDEIVWIDVLEGSSRKVEKKLLERLLRLRRRVGPVISNGRCQSTPADIQLTR